MSAVPGSLLDPPKRKLTGPVIDAHTHLGLPDPTGTLLAAADRYGIKKLLGIADPRAAAGLAKHFPGRLEFATSLNYRTAAFTADNLERVRQAAAAGFRAIKFWFKPTFLVQSGLTLDAAPLEPIFEEIGRLGLAALVHLADPDIWFEKHYRDAAVYGTKAAQYPQLEAVLTRHRTVKIIGAHFGGLPEHLDRLAELLRAHPNLFIDTSATKWVARELSRRADAARDFMLEHADRILFGSDLVVRDGWALEDYASRYWVQQFLWEGSGRVSSPIDDPDSDGPVELAGLDLPADVLEKVYRTNAARILGIVASSDWSESSGVNA